jgi:regulatory protein
MVNAGRAGASSSPNGSFWRVWGQFPCINVTIISIKTGAGGEFRRIELSDGSFFSFKTGYLPPVFVDESLFNPGTAEGRDINADEEAGFRFASACLRAEKAALQLIARAEQTIAGLSRKLEKRGHGTACVRAVLSQLAELALVDDCRYARLWLESRASSRASSPRRLLAALCARGIDREDAERALRSVLDSETEAALLARYAKKILRSRRSAAPSFSLKHALRGEGFSRAAVEIFLEQEGAER